MAASEQSTQCNARISCGVVLRCTGIVAIAGTLLAGCGGSDATKPKPSAPKVAQDIGELATPDSDAALLTENDQPDSASRQPPLSRYDATGGNPTADDAGTSTAEDAGTSSVDAPEASLRDEIIAAAETYASQGNHQAAIDQYKQLLLRDPGDVEILFRMAQVEAASGNLVQAVAFLSEIPADHPQAGFAAIGQSADWYFQLERYGEAERRYRQVLAKVPDAAPALRQLAFLLNRQGRRQEAAELIRGLCRLGDVRQDELHALIAIGDAMFDDPSEAVSGSDGKVRYWPIGNAALARKRFNEQRYQEALELLQESVDGGQAAPSIVALYGRAAAEAQDDAKFKWWLGKTTDQTKAYADYWAAVGTYEIGQRRFDRATRALAEAIARDPTDLASMSRMRQTLGTLGDEQGAQRWFDRWNEVRKVIDANNRVAASSPPQPEAIAELVSLLEPLGRRLEALLWRSIQSHYEGLTPAEMQEMNRERQMLVAKGGGFPSLETNLCGLQLENYPLPELNGIERSTATRTESATKQETASLTSDNRRPTTAALVDQAGQVGLSHTYHVESDPQKQHYAIYQTLGGGVAVIDYDLDGHCDLYFAQGGSDPPEFIGTHSNPLYRQRDGSLREVTEASAADERQYSIGVTSGDWNQDGFPDLAVSNIGASTMFINNGDGTFRPLPIQMKSNPNRVPASLGMGDLNGDHLPDLFHVCYVDDPNMTVKPPLDEEGRVTITVAPGNFAPCLDQLIVNQGTGDWKIQTLASQGKACTGLGLVIADLDNQAGNEVFVGNDSFPNRLWVRDSDGDGFTDVAPLLGCAYGFSGGATGAMGIACGDFDRNGTLDLKVANYENENANLFLRRKGAYQDRNIQYRLGSVTRELVGFGSQGFDYDNDGRLDLAITNGHLDNANSIRGSFEQPAQLFCNLGNRFQLIDNDSMSIYWQTMHVGRGLALLDFNRDGRTDLVVTHVEERSALLINQTETAHHWLQLQLVGCESERDAIGARLSLRTGDQVFSAWVTSGDGYLCRNEAIVSVGLGKATRVDEMEIHWPSGKHQILEDLPCNRRLLVIENEPEAYAFESP